MQIGQQSWYVVSISAIDVDHDRLALSQQMPGQQPQGQGFMAGSLYQDVAKPHAYATGQEITVTLETAGT